MAKGLFKKIKSVFSLNVSLGSDLYNSTGETALECLEKIKPKRFGGWGIFQFTKNGKLAQIRLTGMRVERVFTKQVDKELFAKRLMTLI